MYFCASRKPRKPLNSYRSRFGYFKSLWKIFEANFDPPGSQKCHWTACVASLNIPTSLKSFQSTFGANRSFQRPYPLNLTPIFKYPITKTQIFAFLFFQDAKKVSEQLLEPKETFQRSYKLNLTPNSLGLWPSDHKNAIFTWSLFTVHSTCSHFDTIHSRSPSNWFSVLRFHISWLKNLRHTCVEVHNTHVNAPYVLCRYPFRKGSRKQAEENQFCLLLCAQDDREIGDLGKGCVESFFSLFRISDGYNWQTVGTTVSHLHKWNEGN